MRCRRILPLAVATAIVLPASATRARAQGFNVDAGKNLILFPEPSPAYGGAAGQPGTWNKANPPTYAVALQNLDGSPSGATCASDVASDYAWPFSTLPQDDLNLMEDCQNVPILTTAHWTFSGLADGSYRVYTYAWSPGNGSGQTAISVVGSSDPTQIVGGSWSGSPHVQGITYALHHVTVAGGTLVVEAAGSASMVQGSVNGFQIVPDGFASFCAGDGSLATPCPCANTGGLGRGCDNSASTGGAHLSASGATSPDSVVLLATHELPTALSIFLQGNALVAGGVGFGDGVRCIGGSLKRLAVRNASAGTVSYPQAGDPSISAQSAALGDPIAPGSTRWYQTYYRDPNLAFCPFPQGNSWNVTNGVEIGW